MKCWENVEEKQCLIYMILKRKAARKTVIHQGTTGPNVQYVDQDQRVTTKPIWHLLYSRRNTNRKEEVNSSTYTWWQHQSPAWQFRQRFRQRLHTFHSHCSRCQKWSASSNHHRSRRGHDLDATSVALLGGTTWPSDAVIRWSGSELPAFHLASHPVDLGSGDRLLPLVELHRNTTSPNANIHTFGESCVLQMRSPEGSVSSVVLIVQACGSWPLLSK